MGGACIRPETLDALLAKGGIEWALAISEVYRQPLLIASAESSNLRALLFTVRGEDDGKAIIQEASEDCREVYAGRVPTHNELPRISEAARGAHSYGGRLSVEPSDWLW